MKIIDAFTFFNEIDLLKIRLKLLYDVVDQFFICESNYTHSGSKKSFNFLEQISEFDDFKDKIRYLQYQPDISTFNFSQKDKVFNSSSSTWQLEKSQRNFLASNIENLHDDDLMIISDLDEIWDPEISITIKNKNYTEMGGARLRMKHHYYYMNCIGIGINNRFWDPAFFRPVYAIRKNQNLSSIRTSKTINFQSIENAGWHFSYLGGKNKISSKLNAFAHQEFNTSNINNIEHINKCISLGIDIFGREGHEYAFHPINFYPPVLSVIMRQYPEFLRHNLDI